MYSVPPSPPPIAQLISLGGGGQGEAEGVDSMWSTQTQIYTCKHCDIYMYVVTKVPTGHSGVNSFHWERPTFTHLHFYNDSCSYKIDYSNNTLSTQCFFSLRPTVCPESTLKPVLRGQKNTGIGFVLLYFMIIENWVSVPSGNSNTGSQTEEIVVSTRGLRFVFIGHKALYISLHNTDVLLRLTRSTHELLNQVNPVWNIHEYHAWKKSDAYSRIFFWLCKYIQKLLTVNTVIYIHNIYVSVTSFTVFII